MGLGVAAQFVAKSRLAKKQRIVAPLTRNIFGILRRRVVAWQAVPGTSKCRQLGKSSDDSDAFGYRRALSRCGNAGRASTG